MQDRLRSTTDASQRASELRSLSYRLIDAARLTTNGARQRIAAVRHSIPLRRSPTPEGGDALAPVVLVIDDHKDTREMYMVALEACGYRGWQAKDGANALALASKSMPAVVVTDVRMPGKVTAMEVCRFFRSMAVWI